MPVPLPPSPWLSCPSPQPSASLRLWCFPFAGGGAAPWRPWAEALAPDIEVVSWRLPGRESRLAEPTLARPGELVDALWRELELAAQGEFVFWGHSLGGLLAFAVMRELAHRGRTLPRALVVSAIRAPHLPRTEPDLHTLPDDQLIAQLDRRYGSIPSELRADPGLLALFLPALRADLEVYETFPLLPIAPFDVPILAFGGDDDPMVSRAEMLGWRAHTRAEFRAIFVPGGHFFLETQRPAILTHLRQFLPRLERPTIGAARRV